MAVKILAFSLTVLCLFTLFLEDADCSFLNDLSEGISQKITTIRQSDFLKRTQTKWGAAEKKTIKVVNLVQNGKLGLEIQNFITKYLKSSIGIGISHLEEFLKSLDRSILESSLLVCWIISGVLLSKVLSGSSTLFMMCASLVLHAIYGPVWSMMQFILTIGTFGYFVSLIANNLVLLSMTFATLFVAYKFFGVFRGAREPSLTEINGRLYDLQIKQNKLDSKLQTLEELLQKKG
ncbi:uncharacterized protein LOC117120682 [Anneissia japonica]|uniref:uncharacterized protein LOC117120682 n=1 Tax=Anneissia japonica TaxID=1529436 RepID=UPI0014256949|nr:uncharacterized protein LOC117120682 [Anneissia japonica]